VEKRNFRSEKQAIDKVDKWFFEIDAEHVRVDGPYTPVRFIKRERRVGGCGSC
jgi:hypothetical protein